MDEPFDYDEYVKRCTILRNLITSKYAGHKISFMRNSETLMLSTIIDNNEIIIQVNMEWKHLCDCIDEVLDPNAKKQTCLICSDPIERIIQCTDCKKSFCGECYISIFRKNKGVIKCPSCKYTFGDEVPDHLLEGCISNIREKFLD